MRDEVRFYGYDESPIGWIEICCNENGILSLEFIDEPIHEEKPHPLTKIAMQQMKEYFEGSRQRFTLPFILNGTSFQNQVWTRLLEIPFGHTSTYQAIANSINKAKAFRAVGAANGRNPISIIIPCHRVIGSDGKLTGYGGGLWRKEWLLKHEGILKF
jgi:methylated-DNA-[protein]-cysteine S-methyltransferase